MSKSFDPYGQKDKQLFAEVQKLKDGNFESYQNIYELSKNYIYKVIYDIVQDHYTTEDMMQETYLQVYNKIDSLREAQAFYVWAGRIASNLTLRYLQKYRREVLVEAADEDGEDFIFDNVVNDNEAFIPESVLENEEQRRIIAGILEGLSPEQKLTVQYFYYEEMSVNDIAALMECSAGTVKSRLNYARKSLKAAVSQFETDNNVKLYSLSSLPIFFLVFKDISEVLALATQAAGAAAVAGGTIGGSAAMAGGTVGSSAAVAGGTAGATIGESVAAATGTVGGAGATVGGGTAVAAGTVGSAGGTGAASGFLGTVAGKVAVAAAVVVVGGAATIAVTQSSRNKAPTIESNVTEQDFVGGAEASQALGNETPTVESDLEDSYYIYPWYVVYDVEVQREEEVVEDVGLYQNPLPGVDPEFMVKMSYYDKDGNLVAYRIDVAIIVEEWGGQYETAFEQYYYPDGTPWFFQNEINFSHSDFPQYGCYDVWTYTRDYYAYSPDGTLCSHIATEMALGSPDYDWMNCILRTTKYDVDGSVMFYDEYEYTKTIDNLLEDVKVTRYNADGESQIIDGELEPLTIYNMTEL